MDAHISPPRSVAPSLHPQQLTPTSKKRNYDGELVNHSSSITPPVELRSTPRTGTRSRSVSPALSAASTPLTELGSTPVLSPSKSDMASSDSKKRKLTFAEREVEKALKKQEKEEKDRQKAEAKAKKEEEKQRKEEEKKAKDAAREEKQRQRDAIKAEKEAEKERRAAEILKKERVYSQLTSFSCVADIPRLKCALVPSSAALVQRQRPQRVRTMLLLGLVVDDPLLRQLIWSRHRLRSRPENQQTLNIPNGSCRFSSTIIWNWPHSIVSTPSRLWETHCR